MSKKLKKMLYILLGIVLVLVISTVLFIQINPAFGGTISEERKKIYANSPQFNNGVFRNFANAPKEMSFSETLGIAWYFFTTKVENATPEEDIPTQQLDPEAITTYSGQPRLIWFGHSAFLLQADGKNILIDPMFGQVAAPHPWLGSSRFSDKLPIAIKDLPEIDAVIYSHDHYDHLDYESVLQLKDKTSQFFVPLGVGVHLERWGVAKDQITEMDWWEEVRFQEIQFICTPAQHFSGRGLGDRMATLWSSWIVRSDSMNLYFSGDSGYAPHFSEIGEKYGPFDLALMECGQYDKRWDDIHMMPEETAIAGLDLKAERIMPIHWGGFKLALHSWTDPVERVTAKAKELQLPLITPQIGDPFPVRNENRAYSEWWINY